METIGWGLLLQLLKWVFIGLVYLILTVVLLAVRRELAQRVQSAPEPGGFLPGRLRVLQAGSDPSLGVGASISLKPITRVGSEADNDIILRDRFVSAHHARLRWDGVRWWVEDLGSRNGTFVQQVQIPAGQPVEVPGSSVIRIGDAAFELLEE